MAIVIPGALADHLTRQTIADTATAATLDAARRGRGRTLVIEPTSTRVLHVISAYAEAILENRTLHTTAEVRAARLWIERAGHAPEPAPQVVEPPHRGNLAETVACPACRVGVGAPCITRAGKPARDIHNRRVEALENAAGVTQLRAEMRRANNGLSIAIDHPAEAKLFAAYAARINAHAQAPAPVRDEPSDWWTITDPASGEEVAHVYGETWQDMTVRAETLPEVRAVIRRHRGFSRRRLSVSELTADQLAQQQEQQRAAARLDRAEEQAAAAFADTAHTADAVEHAEQVEAGAATVGEAVTLYDAHLAAEAETLLDDELRHAAALVTEAEATDGTWRGEWIGDTPADEILFVADRTVEQGALFDDRATAPAVDEPIVVRVSFDDDTLARIKVKADADRAAYRAETDDRIAAEHRTFGAPVPAAVQARIDARTAEQAAPVAEPVDFRDVAEGDVVTFLTANNGYGDDGHPFMRTGTVRTKTDDTIVVDCTSNRLGATARLTRRAWAERSVCRIEQAPARRVLVGKIVEHNGRTKGSAPKHSTDPDTRAALDALAALRLAEVTDHTDITAQAGDLDHTQAAWGFLVEPRGHGRVALYWIEAGRYVGPDGKPFAVELEIGAERLRKAGWKIETGTHRCVMAWRPE
ncbi:hypothetical protein SEA_PICARD_53 [Streptomyces phage Picard]|uniref:DNA-binding phage zinc finger domain-containing protein n=1 Tax=Streptomyces phage Picard TaxID=1920311 RepID=A0A1J0MCL2_9CAUD|nr:hypothetical protein HOR45_gp53 [Streptomyces phage Picard]APD18582.1 hypothetical protein SEA_PICARD_53 [Streptomyces phage Picard]